MLRLVVALRPEARPLIVRWGLRADPDARAFPIYRSDDAALVLSGVGRTAAAAATAYLATRTGAEDEPGAWLNVGVAGHARRPIGEALLAHKVEEAATGRAWYPPQIVSAPCPTDLLITVDVAERRFADDAAYDMEASGFVTTAGRFASAELVHCLKVVSDGPGGPARLRAHDVEELVAARLDEVAAVADSLALLASVIAAASAPPPDYQRLVEAVRCSASQRRELRRLLRRRQALGGTRLPAAITAARTGSELLGGLRAWLSEQPRRLGSGPVA